MYVVYGRPLRFRSHILTKGVEVPGAADWTRLEAWVSARQVRLVAPGEEYTTYEAFTGMSLEDELAAEEVERLEAELAEEAERQRAEQAAKELFESQQAEKDEQDAQSEQEQSEPEE